MRQSIDHGMDDHPEGDDDRLPTAWAVAVADDCDHCGDQRVVLTLEEKGRPGTGTVAHLSIEGARLLGAALETARRQLGG